MGGEEKSQKMKHALNAQATAAYSRAVVAEFGQILTTKPAKEDNSCGVQIMSMGGGSAKRRIMVDLINLLFGYHRLLGVRKCTQRAGVGTM